MNITIQISVCKMTGKHGKWNGKHVLTCEKEFKQLSIAPCRSVPDSGQAKFMVE